jgi:hypothetical protein
MMTQETKTYKEMIQPLSNMIPVFPNLNLRYERSGVNIYVYLNGMYMACITEVIENVYYKIEIYNIGEGIYEFHSKRELHNFVISLCSEWILGAIVVNR